MKRHGSTANTETNPLHANCRKQPPNQTGFSAAAQYKRPNLVLDPSFGIRFINMHPKSTFKDGRYYTLTFKEF